MRRLMRRSRRSLALLLVGLAAVLVVGGASGSPTVTIGQTDAGARLIGAVSAAWFVQTGVASGTDYVVPPGNWNITGWSTYAVGAGITQSMSMMVFRPDGFGHYTVVGESPIESLTPGSLNSFADVNFAVQAGDRLGLYDPNGTRHRSDRNRRGWRYRAVRDLGHPAGCGCAPHTQRGHRECPPSEHLRRAEPAGLDGAGHHDQLVARGAEREQRLVHRTGGACRSARTTTAARASRRRVACSIRRRRRRVFGDVLAGCTYLGAGADVASDGQHEVYAASEDNAGADETPVSASFKIDGTPPTVTCAAPMPTFQLGSAGGLVTAVVSDAGSGPVSTSVSATASAATAGAHTVDLTGEDEAGNTATAACPYVVGGYMFGGFSSPLPKSTVKSGSTLPLKFQLQDASGQPISDEDAQALVSPSCKIAIILVKPAGPVPGCPSYDPTSKQFQLNLKTTAAMKGAERRLGDRHVRYHGRDHRRGRALHRAIATRNDQSRAR